MSSADRPSKARAGRKAGQGLERDRKLPFGEPCGPEPKVGGSFPDPESTTFGRAFKGRLQPETAQALPAPACQLEKAWQSVAKRCSALGMAN